MIYIYSVLLWKNGRERVLNSFHRADVVYSPFALETVLTDIVLLLPESFNKISKDWHVTLLLS